MRHMRWVSVLMGTMMVTFAVPALAGPGIVGVAGDRSLVTHEHPTAPDGAAGARLAHRPLEL